MPGCTLDTDKRIVTVTQSFLKDYLMCPERARRQVNRHVPSNNDATARGHALHRYMERRLEGMSIREALLEADERLVALYSADNFVWEQVKRPETLHRHVGALCTAFERHVLRQVPLHGTVEHTLTHRIDDWLDADWAGYEVYLSGTPDYTVSRCVWDWKSTARWWDRYETGAWDIQSIAYTWLWTLELGVPVQDFTFVVGVVPHGELQIIDLVRTQDDALWLREIIRGLVLLMNGYGTENPWPLNHQHWLCSPRWCPFWTTCRGRFVPPEEDEPDR